MSPSLGAKYRVSTSNAQQPLKLNATKGCIYIYTCFVGYLSLKGFPAITTFWDHPILDPFSTSKPFHLSTFPPFPLPLDENYLGNSGKNPLSRVPTLQR